MKFFIIKWLGFIFLLFLVSCVEEEKSQSKTGFLTHHIQNDLELWTYKNFQGEITGQLQCRLYTEPKNYTLLEKYGETFQDMKPIHCVLVAIDQYKQKPLLYCKEDMKHVQDYFQEHFKAYNQSVYIIKLYDENATKDNVIQALQYQKKWASLYSTTCFIFSGHGTSDGLQLYDTIISLSELYHYFQSINALRTIWIIDSCYAGILNKNASFETKDHAFTNSFSLFPIRTPYQFMHCFLGMGKILLCSSQSNEKAKDGIFIPAVFAQLESTENSIQFPQIIVHIKQGIEQYNQSCRPDNKIDMTPFFYMIGDIQIAVVPYFL